jgi:predicted XRE-type DNA-binding protein
MMMRDKPIRRAKGMRVKITPALRKQVIALSKTGMSQHQITSKVGLRNSGRVSEILRKKR